MAKNIYLFDVTIFNEGAYLTFLSQSSIRPSKMVLLLRRVWFNS